MLLLFAPLKEYSIYSCDISKRLVRARPSHALDIQRERSRAAVDRTASQQYISLTTGTIINQNKSSPPRAHRRAPPPPRTSCGQKSEWEREKGEKQVAELDQENICSLSLALALASSRECSTYIYLHTHTTSPGHLSTRICARLSSMCQQLCAAGPGESRARAGGRGREEEMLWDGCSLWAPVLWCTLSALCI